MNAKERELAIYLYGRNEVYLEGLARSPGVSKSELAKGLAELLLGQESWSLLGDYEGMPALPRHGTNSRVQGQVPPEPPIHVRPRGDVRQQAKGASLELECKVCGYGWKTHSDVGPDGPKKCPKCGSWKWREGGEKRRIVRTAKGFSYQGTHWTQSPAGRKKMIAIRRASVLARQMKPSEKPKKTGHGVPKSGVHWTQTPAGKERMRKRMKKFWAEGRFSKPLGEKKAPPSEAPEKKPKADFFNPSDNLKA